MLNYVIVLYRYKSDLGSYYNVLLVLVIANIVKFIKKHKYQLYNI